MSIVYSDIQSVTYGGNVVAREFIGGGQFLDSLPHGLHTGMIRCDTTAGTVRVSAAANVHVPDGAVHAARFVGDGSALHSLDARSIGAGTIDVARLPHLDAAHIRTGTLESARVPYLDATRIGTGVLSRDRIPPLHAAHIAGGVFDPGRIPPLHAANVYAGVFDIERIPELSATMITSGTLKKERIPTTLNSTKIDHGLIIPATGEIQFRTTDNDACARLHVVDESVALWTKSRGRVTVSFGETRGAGLSREHIFLYPTNAVYIGNPATPMAARTRMHKLHVDGNVLIMGNLHVSGRFVGNGSALHSLDASRVSSGTLHPARLPPLHASAIGAGTLDPARLPPLDAAIIARGKLGIARLPPLDASIIATGVLHPDRVPAGDIDASRIASGVLDAKRIPRLDAGKIAWGTLDVARLPPLDASVVASGVLDPDRIPALDASKIVGGTLAPAVLPPISSGTLVGRISAKCMPRLDASMIAFGVLSPDRLPPLTMAAENVTSGVLNVARIPHVDASHIASGTLDVARVPALDASRIRTGQFDPARIPPLDSTKIATGIIDRERLPEMRAEDVRSGVLNVGRIPPLDASKIVSGVVRHASIPHGLGNGNLVVLEDGAVCMSRDFVARDPPGSATEVRRIDDALARLSRLKGVLYKDGEGLERAGLLREDVEQALPEAVRHGAVQYHRIVPLLVEAVLALSRH